MSKVIDHLVHDLNLSIRLLPFLLRNFTHTDSSISFPLISFMHCPLSSQKEIPLLEKMYKCTISFMYGHVYAWVCTVCMTMYVWLYIAMYLWQCIDGYVCMTMYGNKSGYILKCIDSRFVR